MNHNPYLEDKLGFEEAGGQEQELGDSGILEPAGVTVFTLQLDQKVRFSEKIMFLQAFSFSLLDFPLASTQMNVFFQSG